MAKRLLQSLILLVLAAGCSKYAFNADKDFNKCHNSGLNCELISKNVERFNYDVKIGSGLVDILFVDDNSGSMSPEQGQMAQRFPNFLQSLGHLDYHIAITTTDVSYSVIQGQPNGPKPANGNGAYQDGRFIPFASGISVLTRDTANKENLFSNTIQRPETIQCEQNRYSLSYCPSPDERGIFAAHLAVERRESNFFRPKAHFALVILADEDERSKGGSLAEYPLEAKDKPETLIAAVKNYLGKDKTFSAHAIIIRPGDTSCLQQQNQSPPIGGSYGNVYAQLATSTKGTTGSICSTDYGRELGEIGYNIQEQVNSIALVCPPLNDAVEVVVTPEPAGLNVTFDAPTKTVRFNQTLPPNTNVHLTYDCNHL